MGGIALFGAAGAIGRSIAAALRVEGRPYRVVGRSRPALEREFGADPLAEIVIWTPDDPESVRAAARGMDTIVHLVGVPYHQFQLHPVVMRQVLDGAAAEGVARLLLVGTVYPYGRPRTLPVREDHPREPHTFKGRMRKAQEDLVLEAAGRIRGAVLRLPDFYGPSVERSLLHDLFQAAASGRRAKLIGPIDRPHEFAFVPDIGPVVTALAAREEAWGRVWHLAGPGTITQREAAALAFAAAGRKPRLMVAGKTMLRLAGLFDPLMRELVEMHYLQTDPVVMDDGALQALIGPIRKTPYAEGIRRCVEAAAA
ncbi:NAD-dependent epimerase/dehydratase family protein [Mycobacterium sp. KBS0706]|uniref:NAD-dependent epimerase/dehydratase family protein n=1 Tax=Mycobacterium sp. KBS0706 TaxID=2578109 RepID=UPI00110FA9A9|nr:NAD-dependent epimerase/dehydratase family protein [Mycobacterium sp. KBS0706]TSD83374.1 NAD-dependent epimerase/dehydratase family protein [Mycobacterium sp. KBS0706]